MDWSPLENVRKLKLLALNSFSSFLNEDETQTRFALKFQGEEYCE
jgi:hypothetical protein